MWVLPIVGYFGVVSGICLLVTSFASGLYYLSELVEEYTVITKRLLTQLIYSIIAVHVLLWVVDRFPLRLAALAIFSHCVYLQTLRASFPHVRLTHPAVLASPVLVLLNHWAYFRHFRRAAPGEVEWARGRGGAHENSYFYGKYGEQVPDPTSLPTFNEVSSFFGICVWLVPLALFVSLSATTTELPSVQWGSAGGGGERGGTKGGLPGDKSSSRVGGMAKQAINMVRNYGSESWQIMFGNANDPRLRNRTRVNE